MMRSIFASIAVLAPLSTTVIGAPTAAPMLWGLQDAARSALSTVTCPLSNGTAELPPPAGLQLKALSLGRGTQNYTCTTPGGAAAPSTFGASALLLDITPALPYIPSAAVLAYLAAIPAYTLPFSRALLEKSRLPRDGVHYFDGSLSPVFDLTRVGLGTMVGAKTGNIAAPKNSTQGPHGAVDWLELGPKDGAPPCRVTRVYRVNTASGKAPPTCENVGKTVEVEYAALYYFYGPA